MEKTIRAALFIDGAGFKPVLESYYHALKKLFDGLCRTDAYHDQITGRMPLPFPARHHLTFREHDQPRPYDVLIYQNGGRHPSYLTGYGMLYPGLAISCGTCLPLEMKREEEKRRALFDFEMARQYGGPGRKAAGLLRDGNPGRFFNRHFPLYPSFLDQALGVITYTDYEKKRIEKRWAGRPVIRIPIPVSPGKSVREPAEALSKSPGLTVMCLQEIRSPLLLEDFLDAFSSLRREGRRITVAMPFRGEKDRLRQSIQERPYLGDVIIPLNRSDRRKMRHYGHKCDLFLDLEPPDTLEGYWRVMEALGSGRPVLIPDLPEYAELPEDICVKLDTGRDRRESLYSFMSLMDDDGLLRKRLPVRAARYLSEVHDPAKSRESLRRFLRKDYRDFRREAQKRSKHFQEARAKAASDVFARALSTLDIAEPHYLQRELVRMLRWGG